MKHDGPVRFSVLIATRNRPVLLRRAVESVMRQDCADWEIVLVNDGSDDIHLASLAELVRELGPRVQRRDLPRRTRGHGPSFAQNECAAIARGDYLCFLDDDDEWIDDGHLSRLAHMIDGQVAAPDLLLANQQACRDGVPVQRVVWIEDLLARAVPPLRADATGAFPVTPAQLLCATGFGHLNATTIRRTHFERIGGFDEGLRYENDRDFNLRAIDQADTILYVQDVIARHHIPDPAARASMSTIVGDLEKRVFQLRLLDKAILFARQEAVQAYARRHKAYTLKRIATEAAAMGADRTAAHYALEAAGARFTFGWAGYTMLLLLRLLWRRGT
ncbi:MAG: glycosyltransferase [Alphaproteobacteria bacterium]|nr:glycosyltransferase [Alphaproteobacteria bacterium]